jgi:hypothetical protein
MDKKFDYLNFNIEKKTIDYSIKPKLVDRNAKYFLNSVLQKCYKIKIQNFNKYYNMIMLSFFIILLLTILKIKYKGNINKDKYYLQQQKNKEYIFNKLMIYNKMDNERKQSIKNDMITNLPDFNNHPEKTILQNLNNDFSLIN